MKIKKLVGLRTATPSEIAQYMRDFRSQGFIVKHITEGLPFNGVLKVYEK